MITLKDHARSAILKVYRKLEGVLISTDTKFSKSVMMSLASYAAEYIKVM